RPDRVWSKSFPSSGAVRSVCVAFGVVLELGQAVGLVEGEVLFGGGLPVGGFGHGQRCLSGLSAEVGTLGNLLGAHAEQGHLLDAGDAAGAGHGRASRVECSARALWWAWSSRGWSGSAPRAWRSPGSW